MNDKTISIDEQNVSNLHIFLMSSFFQLCIGHCENCDVGSWSETNNYNLSFVWMWEITMYSPCFLTLVRSKANPSNENPLDQ